MYQFSVAMVDSGIGKKKEGAMPRRGGEWTAADFANISMRRSRGGSATVCAEETVPFARVERREAPDSAASSRVASKHSRRMCNTSFASSASSARFSATVTLRWNSDIRSSSFWGKESD